MLTAVQESRAKRKLSAGPLRVAVVGCGAISRGYHIPVLAGHDGVRLAALVDRDLVRTRELAKAYGVPTVVADVTELPPDAIDAALIATPPFHHAPCCIDLAQRGWHLFVEKPMAITGADAWSMVEAADAAGVVLSVGHFRRLFPSTRLLRSLLEQGYLGQPLRVDAEEGDEYTWNLATLSNLRKDQGGGGVLIDIGSHVLDVILFCFPDRCDILEYRDNSLGAIETDCALRLRLHHEGKPVEARVELSRTRKLRSSIRIHCERGTLELRTGERYRVNILPNDVELVDPALGTPREVTMQANWTDEREALGYEAYRMEIDDWLNAIRTGGQPVLSGPSTLRTVELIEGCYGQASKMIEPWVWHGIPNTTVPAEPRAEASERNGHAAAPAVLGKSERPRRILVTGASGFIGCRVAELLHLREGCQVRAMVHNPRSAARLARLPVEMVQADLQSKADMARVVQGCDAIVHCAIGTAYGDRRSIFAVTVGGARNLTEAALAAGVRRLVHLSSIAVHGNDVAGLLDETTPIKPPKGDDYSESKAEAEQVIQRAARAGLPAIMLRPGNVYGPFSRTFSIRPIQYMAQGKLVLQGSADLPSNTVYVDNVVQAILRGLAAPEDIANGQAFTISDGDDLTWGDFYGYFARAMGVDLKTAPAEEAAGQVKRGAWNPVSWVRSWFRGLAQIFSSQEFKSFGRRCLQTDPIGTLPRYLLQRFPVLDRTMRRMLKVETAMVYRRAEDKKPDIMRVRSRPALIKMDRARTVLGYELAAPRDRAMALTLEWLRHARLAPAHETAQ
jgi:predicted dehydrogenase/nucleoside-diphosphate-sugar epimerase